VTAFVLVHGGWHGGWCWRRVVPLLRAAGHEVATPTLTGLGERAHLASPAIDLTTHVEDIAGVLGHEDLRDVVLVGHSYAGAVITCAADRIGERLRHLVHLDAFIPREGESVLDLLPAERRAGFEHLARTEGEGWRIPLEWRSALHGWGVSEEDDLRWMVPRMTPQPLRPMQEPIVTGRAAARLPRTFIHCRFKPAGDTFAPAAAQARREGWRVRELDVGHDAMVTAPREVADLLLELA
jgi:pimeloyl-ACP methyl ester carboxylesterase